MHFPLFIARRIYAAGDDAKKASRPAVAIATAGVAIGLAVMIVSVAVVFGFKHTVQGKVIGFGSHIQVASFATLQTTNVQPVEMNDSMMAVLRGVPGVKHVERFGTTQGILKTESDFLGVMLKGVGQEYDTTFIHGNLREGRIPRFGGKSASNDILISATMADKLRLKAGDRVFAYFIGGGGVRMRRFTVAGIYDTNLSQYDKVVCYADLATVVKLNGWQADQVTGAEISVDDFGQLEVSRQYIINKVNRTIDKYGVTYSSKTIQEINPQIFSWLDLLDLNVWIILALMIVVASVTMVSGLLIIILERTSMIGLLKALGARGRSVRHVFMWLATFILGKGMVYGNVLAFALMLAQKYLGVVKLDPQTYYVSTVPVEINLPAIVAINVVTLLMGVLVLVLPSYLVSHIHPAKSMQFE